jgi:hypothetical protein
MVMFAERSIAERRGRTIEAPTTASVTPASKIRDKIGTDEPLFPDSLRCPFFAQAMRPGKHRADPYTAESALRTVNLDRRWISPFYINQIVDFCFIQKRFIIR